MQAKGTFTPDVAEAHVDAARGHVISMEEEELRLAWKMAEIDARLAKSVDSRFMSSARETPSARVRRHAAKSDAALRKSNRGT